MSALTRLEFERCLTGPVLLRRLFSTFARGWPGAALLFMRLVAAFALADQGIARLPGAASSKVFAFALTAMVLAILLGAGLWTPVVGGLVALTELWNVFARTGDPWFHVLLGTLGVALALLGPGAWSVDARLFGWKRIYIRDRKS